MWLEGVESVDTMLLEGVEPVDTMLLEGVTFDRVTNELPQYWHDTLVVHRLHVNTVRPMTQVLCDKEQIQEAVTTTLGVEEVGLHDGVEQMVQGW